MSPEREPSASGTAGAPDQTSVDAFVVRGGALLLERRRADARTYPGLWDVPGGRVEPGESGDAALARELREELDVAVEESFLAATIVERDPASGLLCRHLCYVVTRCRGAPRAAEGQHLAWQPLAGLAALSPIAPLVPRLVAELRALGRLGETELV